MSEKAMDLKPTRRISLVRLLILLALIGFGAYFAQSRVQRWQEQAIVDIKPWFAPYVDVTATPRYAFEQLDYTSVKNLVLSFIVAHPSNPCLPSWGTHYTMDEAATQLDLDRRIARYRQQGGNISVSFGGLLNRELSVSCKDKDALIQAYISVIDRYDLDTIDLDLEGESLTDVESIERRASIMRDLQQRRKAEGKNLSIWLTLPVAPFGLTQQGTDVVAKMLAGGVDLAGVNVMTMNYGQSKDRGQSMQKASESALLETHRQLGILYRQAGINLSDASIWAKIGATPMIGQNDVAGEVFSLEDASGFNAFAISKGISRMSMWSVNRDIQCGENYVNWAIVSDACSGVRQEKLGFSLLLGNGFDGKIAQHAALTTISDPERSVVPIDVPEESPYQIWHEKGVYLQGTKVVWRRNVYQAKWWTQGDIPDNPVLQSWETPWLLVGPVLPGEKPIPRPTLPEGIYPEWQGTQIYEAGQRVIFNQVPYQAKWWTQGDSPAAATSSPDSSPWVALTQRQVDEIIKKHEGR